MNSKLKQIIFISALSLVGGIAFSQEKEDHYATQPIEKEEGVYEVVDKQAEFPGGMEELQKFIASNLKTVKEVEEMEIKGKCFIQLTILETGEISNVKILMGVTDCWECDQEAIRMVKTMPKWKPAELKGQKVKSHYKLPPIYFKQNSN